MAQETPAKLQNLINEVKMREEKFGYVLDDQLLAIAKEITENRSKYDHVNHAQAVMLLAKYHMAALAYNRGKIREYEEYENKQPRTRCSHCGAVISSKKSLETGLGVVCRKKLGVGAKAEKKEGVLNG